MIGQLSWTAVVVGCSCLGHGRAEAGFILTANAAGSESSTVAGVTTETFDSFGTGKYTSLTTAIGTISSPGLEIVAHDQYGGSGAVGNYIAVGAESGQATMTLDLSGDGHAYFGFEWAAADAMNRISFMSDGQVVASFDPVSALGALGAAYYGNPTTYQDQGEKFAYLNFIGTSGSTFDQVVFSNASNSTGFESDNWSVRTAQLSTSNDPGSVINGVVSVPEPSSLALSATGILALLGVHGRPRRRGHRPSNRVGDLDHDRS